MTEKHKPDTAGNFQVAQKLVIYREDTKQFLLVKEQKKNSFSSRYGAWDLPGGRLDEGEDATGGLKRELVEELGEELVLDQHGPFTTQVFPLSERVVYRVGFLAHYLSGDINISDEHSEYSWLTAEEIKQDETIHEWLKGWIVIAQERLKELGYLTDLQRMQADFENYKKRQAAESKEFSAHLAKSIVTDLIPVLDNLHAAAEHVPTDLKESSWVMGITYIEKQFEDALKNYGVEPIEVKPGDPFNPTEHEAIDTENQELGIENQEKNQETIARIVQKGYKVGNKIIKPAKVVVKKS